MGTLISLTSLDSFPLEGGSHYGTRNVRPYGTAPSPDGLIRPISPSVICFANSTSLVRGRLFVGFTPHITGELPILWDVFIHLLEIGRYCAQI